MPRKAIEAPFGVSVLPGSAISAALINRLLHKGLAHFLQYSQTLVVVLDKQGRPVAANPAFDRLHEALPGARDVLDLVLPVHRQRLEAALSAARHTRTAVREQIDFGGVETPIRCECSVIPAGQGAILVVAEPIQSDRDLVVANADLEEELSTTRAALDMKRAELQAVLAQADELAHTDSLTLLPNRRSIIADLQRQVTYAERYRSPLALSMLDLDGFKAVNDQLGHSVGDKVLSAAARGLRDRIRQPDQIGRYGGDEFMVILPNSTAAAASEQAARLCEYVRTAPLSPVDGPVTRLTLSVGITHLQPGDDNWRTLLERADRALYEAKRQGGDRWLILES